jgi:hypothetical protein
MIYLRPDEFHRPTKYERSLEKAGLVVLPQQNLALWTVSTGQGATGPKGDKGDPYQKDTIIASCSDEYSDLEVDLVAPATTYRAPYPIEISYVRCSLTTAPTGADIIVDVHMNGVSIFGTLLRIDAGSKTSVGSGTPYTLTTTTVPDDAELEIFITQVGATVAGSGLKISITGDKQEIA